MRVWDKPADDMPLCSHCRTFGEKETEFHHAWLIPRPPTLSLYFSIIRIMESEEIERQYMNETVVIIGAGLAGSECALQLAQRGIHCTLFEQRPTDAAPAHKTDLCAELVCSNSLKSLKEDTAAGMLKQELTLLGSQLLQIALDTRVPAGGALAVDRIAFSEEITRRIGANPYITLVRQEVSEIPEGSCVIAAGPLCSGNLFEAIQRRLGTQRLSFYDAAAPIVNAETLDWDCCFVQDRYGDDQDTGDYINCPLTKEEYEYFIEALTSAERVIAREFEQKDLFCACQPLEEVARTGLNSLRFGALKPVGLTDPRTGKRPWAVVQLRKENTRNASYNLVGFQTNLTFPEQKRVFSLIPALKHVEFERFGVMHRNTFVDAPHTLDRTFAIPHTSIRFAGQITGTEGYVEAIASGLMAALHTFADLQGISLDSLPTTSAFGSLSAYATSPETDHYQPMHVNFGLFDPLDPPVKQKAQRKLAYVRRGLQDMQLWKAKHEALFEAH